MAIVDTTLETENKGGNYKYDVFMQDSQEGLFGADNFLYFTKGLHLRQG